MKTTKCRTSEAKCENCSWRAHTDESGSAMGNGAKHSKRTGHTVLATAVVESRYTP